MTNNFKRKTLAIAGVLGLAGLVFGAGTLAYFNDSDSATNTFTVGNVGIELHEKQRALDDDGNKTEELEDFENDKVMYPIVGSAQGEKDSTGLPTAKNYVDKIVTIENTKNSDAWVRAYFAIPSKLDDGYDTFNAGLNMLHFNFGNDANGTTYGTTWSWMHGNKWNYFETTIDDVAYNVYFADYMEKLPAGATTTQFVQGLYLDKDIDINDAGNLSITRAGVTKDLGVSASEKIKCPVFAVAVQAAGFDNAKEAVEAAFGTEYNPWGTASSNWQ